MLKTYSYQGPVFRFAQVVFVLTKPIVTQAISKSKAINNIKYKLKQQLKLTKNSIIDIDEYKVQELLEENEIEWCTALFCNKCGYQLNPLGQCPVCDYEEYDLVEN